MQDRPDVAHMLKRNPMSPNVCDEVQKLPNDDAATRVFASHCRAK
jgi:hypothetical protein